jgi:outer membrane murein-binding lipoprotein Lpp
MEIMQAMQLMHTPPAPARDDDRGVTKLIVGGVVILIGAIMLGLFGWVGTSVNGLNTTVTKMSTNVDQLQKSIAELQQTQGSAAQQLSDLRITNTRQDARHDAVEADLKRMKERIRMAEGQRPLSGDTGDI